MILFYYKHSTICYFEISFITSSLVEIEILSIMHDNIFLLALINLTKLIPRKLFIHM